MLHRRTSTRSLILALAMLAAVFSLTACQQPPQTDVDAARVKLQEVTEAPAAVYAEAEVAAAREALAAVDAEVAAQSDRFAPTRSYDRTVELIREAQTRTEAARVAAITGREQAKTEAEQAMTTIRGNLDAAQTLLAELATCPSQPKGFSSDLELMKAQLDAVSPELITIEQALGTEDYRGVTTRAATVGEHLDHLVADLNGAKSKLRC